MKKLDKVDLDSVSEEKFTKFMKQFLSSGPSDSDLSQAKEPTKKGVRTRWYVTDKR